MASKIRVAYIVSGVEKALALEWAAAGLSDEFDLLFILLNPGDTELERYLRVTGVRVIRIRHRGRADAPMTFLRLLWTLFQEQPRAVHAHLIDATLLGLAAAWLTGVERRVYTRHSSTLHHKYHPAAVKYDHWSNWLSTHVVSISQATDECLLRLEGVSPERVVKIPHGFDLGYFSKVSPDRVAQVERRWSIPRASPRIGVIGRHVEWKGIQYIIPAFTEFLKEYPGAVLILANAGGPYHHRLMEMLKGVPRENCVVIPFETDIAALYRQFDLYVHTPVDRFCEAFGQTYVEALVSGVPSIFTLSGIAAEFVHDGEDALVVEYRSSAAILAALKKLWASEALRERLAAGGKKSVTPRFELEPMIQGFARIYR